MNKESSKELQWWIQNSKLCNGTYIIQHRYFVIIKTDAFKKRWDAFSGGEWTLEEKETHINILKLKPVKLALTSFHKQMKMKTVHFQINNTTALTYLLKMGGLGTRDFWTDQGYMGLYTEEWDHDYSRISAKLPKRGGRLEVKEPQEQFRVETSSPNNSSNLPNKKDSRDRPVCISAVTSASKIFCLETGPIQLTTDAILGKANTFIHSFLSQ